MDSGLSTFFGSLAGFSASVMPHVLDLYKQAQAHRHLMEEKKLDLEAAAAGYEFELKKADTTASTDELKALLAHDTKMEGASPWLTNLRASVRPVITYLFMLLFVFVKMATFVRFVFYADVNPVTAIEMLWDAETIALFSAVLSFWFGSRAMADYRMYARNRTRK